jgi:hypothetical protein
MRVAARCLRWRHKQNQAVPLTVDEMISNEIRTLQKDWLKDVGGKLQSLNPFIDKEGILRVGGRLSNSPIPFQQKYPIILPKVPITELIIRRSEMVNTDKRISGLAVSNQRSPEKRVS